MSNFVRNLIESIDELIESRSPIEECSHLAAELITPEWYYSESFQIFNEVDVTWDSILQSDLIVKLIKDLQDNKTDKREIIFEKSFCSWYQPYHFIPRTKWGIHIRYTSWVKIARRLSEECPSLISKPKESLVAAFLYLYYHGLFHHIIENAASMIEVDAGKLHNYRTYYSDVYIETFNSLDCIEESLANSYLFEHSKYCHIDINYLKNELLSQPDAYKEFIKFTGENFARGSYELISRIGTKQTVFPYVEVSKRIFERSMSCDNGYERVPIWLHRKPLPVY
jgi:hypothetical protein